MASLSDTELEALNQAILRLEPLCRMEDDFREFAKAAWPTILPGRPLKWGWMMDALCDHLQAVAEGDIKQLSINVPPRNSKSSLVSVMFPIWWWTRDPKVKFICVSHTERLAVRDNVASRRLMESEWFRWRWGDLVKAHADQNAKERMDTIGGGMRLAMGIDSALTGEGGDCISGNAMIATNMGYVAMAQVAADINRYSALSYCHQTGEFSFQRIVASKKVRRADYCVVSSAFADAPPGEVDRFWCTPEHRIWSCTDESYIPACDLVGRDMPKHVIGLGADRNYFFQIEHAGPSAPEMDFYDIQVERNHNFFAGKILVHNCIIMDDLNSPNNRSDVMIERAIDWFRYTMPTRLNDFSTGRKINVQQRIDERDISGFIQSNEAENWVKLILPMEYEENRKCITVPLRGSDKPWEDPRTVEGELLFPERFNADDVRRLKMEFGSEYEIAGQLQQRPAPGEGGIIKRNYFKPWMQNEVPPLKMIIQSWDTAISEKKTAAYSACLTLGVLDSEEENAAILLGAWRGKVEFPSLYNTVKFMGNDYRIKSVAKTEDGSWAPDVFPDGKHGVDVVLVEEKSSGMTLLQMLRNIHFDKAQVLGFNPTRHGDKVERVRKITHLLEAGALYVPMKPPSYTEPKNSAQMLIEQAVKFPVGDSRDIVDCLSQAFLWLQQRGWLRHPMDSVAFKEEIPYYDPRGDLSRPVY